jgi:hypothetical protein
LPNVFSGKLVKAVTGPAFNAVQFQTANVVGATVSVPTFAVTDRNNAMLAYTVDGIAQSKWIMRLVFGPPGTVCQ